MTKPSVALPRHFPHQSGPSQPRGQLNTLSGFPGPALTEALSSDDTRAEASELIRSLIEAIVLVPEDGALKVALKGTSPAFFSFARTAKSPRGFRRRAFCN